MGDDDGPNVGRDRQWHLTRRAFLLTGSAAGAAAYLNSVPGPAARDPRLPGGQASQAVADGPAATASRLPPPRLRLLQRRSRRALRWARSRTEEPRRIELGGHHLPTAAPPGTELPRDGHRRRDVERPAGDATRTHPARGAEPARVRDRRPAAPAVQHRDAALVGHVEAPRGARRRRRRPAPSPAPDDPRARVRRDHARAPVVARAVAPVVGAVAPHVDADHPPGSERLLRAQRSLADATDRHRGITDPAAQARRAGGVGVRPAVRDDAARSSIRRGTSRTPTNH